MMKFSKLVFLIALSTSMLIGCERQLLSPIGPSAPSQTTSQFAQESLLNLADITVERGFVDLANAANGVAETLVMDDGTSVEPMFTNIAKLAGAVTILEHAFGAADCNIELQGLAKASMDAVKAHTIRDAADMEQSLINLAQEASNAKTALEQLPDEYDFMPFAFGYGPAVDHTLNEFFHTEGPIDPLYVPGLILIQYDTSIRPIDETRASAIEVLTQKGYTTKVEGWEKYLSQGYKEWFHLKEYTDQVKVEAVTGYIESIDLGTDVDPLLIMRELLDIPGVSHVQPDVFEVHVDFYYSEGYYIIRRLAGEYNKAWCQGDFDLIDAILIEESGLDFFDYAFVRNLADIYAEEITEFTERIQMNRFSLRWLAEEFLDIYALDPESPLDEVIERFRQSVKTGKPSIDFRMFDHYYHTTDYWKQIVADQLNQ